MLWKDGLRRKGAASRVGCPTATEEDLKRTITLAQKDAVDWVILDGYRCGVARPPRREPLLQHVRLM
jgi:hypothetical protein